jgi:hypothetical protein
MRSAPSATADDAIRVLKCDGKGEGAVSDKTRGQLLVERLRANIDMTTDEIMALMRGPRP